MPTDLLPSSGSSVIYSVPQPVCIDITAVTSSPWSSLAEWFESKLSVMGLESLLRPALPHLCRYTQNVGVMKTSLYSNYALNDEDSHLIDICVTDYKQCERLYMILMKRNEGKNLLEAWKESKNQHIVEYLKNNFQNHPPPRQLSPPPPIMVNTTHAPTASRVGPVRQNSGDYIPLAVRGPEGWNVEAEEVQDTKGKPQNIQVVSAMWLKFYAIAFIISFLLLACGVGIVIYLWGANFKGATVAGGVTMTWSTILPTLLTTKLTAMPTMTTMSVNLIPEFETTTTSRMTPSMERGKCREKTNGESSRSDPKNVVPLLINSPKFRRFGSNSSTTEIFLTIVNTKNATTTNDSDSGNDWLSWRPERQASDKVSKLTLMGQFSLTVITHFCTIFRNVQHIRFLHYR